MKEGWKYEPLSSICNIVGRIGFRGYTKADFVTAPADGAITLSPTNIIDGELSFEKCSYINWDKYYESPEIMIKEGDIVLVKTASIGKCAFVRKLPHETTLNPQFVVLKDLKIDGQFLTHYLHSDTAQFIMRQFASGAAIPTFSQKKLGTMVIPFPPLPEQRAIVAHLDATFAAIDAMKAKTAEELANAKALFEAALREAMQPKEGWEEKTLGEIGICQTGTTPAKSNSENYGCYMPFVRPSEINKDGMGGILYDTELKLSEEGAAKSRLIPKGSILMVCIGATIGKTGVTDRTIACNQQINSVTPKDDINSKYIYYALISPWFQEMVMKEGRSAQATLPIISKGKWEKLSILVPPLATQQSIVSRLDTLRSLLTSLEEKYSKLMADCDALKQAILRETFE